MPTDKDFALVQFLLDGTTDGRVKWEPTAEEDQYAASFKGKYTVTVDQLQRSRGGPTYHLLTLRDSDGRELLRIDDNDYDAITTLFFRAGRASLNVDAAIDEIIETGGGNKRGTQITDDDIPF